MQIGILPSQVNNSGLLLIWPGAGANHTKWQFRSPTLAGKCNNHSRALEAQSPYGCLFAMTNDNPAAQTPSDYPAPKKKTGLRRSTGGGLSGLPPSFRIATGLEDWKNPFKGLEGPSRRSEQPGDLFGIDFGDETTRIAELNAGNPLPG